MDVKGAVPIGARPVEEVVDIQRPRSVIAFAAWFAAGVAVAYLGFRIVEQLRTILYLLAFSLLIGVTLDPLIAFLQRRGMRRAVAALLTWLTVVVLLSAPLVLAVDAASTQLPTLVESGPELIRNAGSHLGPLGDRFAAAVTGSSATASPDPGNFLDYVLTGGALLFTAVTDIVVVAFLSLYFAIGLPHLRGLTLKAFPASRQIRAARIIDELIVQVGRFMLSTVLIAVLCGLSTAIWALAWGIPYAVMLGALVTVLSLVPVIGSTVGGVVVTLVSLTVSLPTAIASLVFYLGYRLFEDYFIQPRVMKYSVELPGVITVPSVILGGAVFGIPGALFGVPLALILRVLVRELVFPATDSA
jgi:predicted PurR-regulated permease PerM